MRTIKKKDIQIAKACMSGMYSIKEAAEELNMTRSYACYHMMRSLREAYKQEYGDE